MHPLRMLAWPLGFTLLLAAFAVLPQVQASPPLFWSFLGTAGALLAWNAGLLASVFRRRRTLGKHFVLRRPHWLQPLVQLSVYLYWGWHWRHVYASAYLIAAQIVFAYAFDMLLAWSRRDEYELGFGIFPIIFSMNLFIWFKDDWFYLQFVMVAAGFAAKELLRWQKDGRSAHIFNPSSFPLALASVALILTGTSDHTYGQQIANTLGEPLHMFEMLFVISIPGQLLFGVAAMTMPAVLTTFFLGAAYHLITGTYYFLGAVPIAAFLGMLLLFTDPSTAPRTELGRILYGVLYGASVFVLYGLLGLLGQQEFYDKLLFVPFLNLGVRALDRLAASKTFSRFDPSALAKRLVGRPRNLAWTLSWAAVFLILLAVQGVGDAHPATRVPYWRQACAEEKRDACLNLDRLEDTLCDRGSGWACNELGSRIFERRSQPSDSILKVGVEALQRACALGFEAGCRNASNALTGRGAMLHQDPKPGDYEWLVDTRPHPGPHQPAQLRQWACEQGWREGCAPPR